MTKKEYVDFVRKSVSQNPCSPQYGQHALLGLISEAGEFCQLERKDKFQGIPMSEPEIISELGDIYFYFTMLLDYYCVNEKQLAIANKAKLMKRRGKVKQ